MFKDIFKNKKNEVEANDPLVPIPIPALITILLNKEQEKGVPLTEPEVLEIRDNAVSMMLPYSHKQTLEESRGYADVDPEYVWEHWQQARIELNENS